MVRFTPAQYAQLPIVREETHSAPESGKRMLHAEVGGRLNSSGAGTTGMDKV